MDNETTSEMYKGHRISIQFDESPESPRDWDNICVIHIGHNRYAFGDKNYDNSESIEEAQNDALKNGDICLPLYLYDHSGISISLSPYMCHWDSGQCGFVQIPREVMLKEFHKKIFTKNLKEIGMKHAVTEIDILNKYIMGQVFGYIVDDDSDSCWGFYSEEDAIETAKDGIDGDIKANIREHLKKLKIWIKKKVPLYARTAYIM